MYSKTIKTIFPVCAVGFAFFCAPMVLADESGGDSTDNIQQMVKEAKQVAQEWAYRIREWKESEGKSSTYMGVVIESVPDVLRDYIDLPKGVGLLLSKIATGGPAEKAGLKDNDILVSFDDQLIVNYSQLSTLIDLKGPDATVPVKVLRKGEELIVEVTLEERIRRGPHFIAPDAPESPETSNLPTGDGVGMLMERIEEWIPGSVQVYIDDNEQVHVDLEDLKENLQGLREKLGHITILKDDLPGLVTEYGDMGARTTLVHVEDKSINYLSKDGKVALSSSAAGQKAMVWDAEGNLLYDGELTEAYESDLPEKAVNLINALRESRSKLDLDINEDEFEIQLNKDGVEPVTWVSN